MIAGDGGSLRSPPISNVKGGDSARSSGDGWNLAVGPEGMEGDGWWTAQDQPLITRNHREG